MVKLFVKDKSNGKIREYGMDKHDSLIVGRDNGLHYYNLQIGEGTMYEFDWCCQGGEIIRYGSDEIGGDVVDIGGATEHEIIRKFIEDCSKAGILNHETRDCLGQYLDTQYKRKLTADDIKALIAVLEET